MEMGPLAGETALSVWLRVLATLRLTVGDVSVANLLKQTLLAVSNVILGVVLSSGLLLAAIEAWTALTDADVPSVIAVGIRVIGILALVIGLAAAYVATTIWRDLRSIPIPIGGRLRVLRTPFEGYDRFLDLHGPTPICGVPVLFQSDGTTNRRVLYCAYSKLDANAATDLLASGTGPPLYRGAYLPHTHLLTQLRQEGIAVARST